MKTRKWLMMLVTLLLITGCSQNDSSQSKKDLKTESAVNQNTIETQKVKTDEKSKKDVKTTQKQEIKKSKVVNEKEIIHMKNESNKTVKEEVKEQPKEESKPIEKAPVETTTPPSQDNSVVEVPETPIVEEPVKQEAMAKAVMNQINAYRQQHGLQPLAQSSYHQQKADSHAYEMAKARALWHQDNGECITNSPDPFSAWVTSPEHNEILLRENNTQGVVSIYYVDGYYYSVFKTSW